VAVVAPPSAYKEGVAGSSPAAPTKPFPQLKSHFQESARFRQADEKPGESVRNPSLAARASIFPSPQSVGDRGPMEVRGVPWRALRARIPQAIWFLRRKLRG
jgi:hypothetical protein